MLLGLAFLVEWVDDAAFRLPTSDYLILLLVLVVIATVGFLEGVAVGILITVILFAIQYSRINVVKHALSGTSYQSSVERPPQCRHVLSEKGEQLAIFKLQGFLFFGTANNLLTRIRARIKDAAPSPLRCIVLDFRLVPGIDTSALHSLIRLQQVTQAQQIALVFTALAAPLRQRLENGGLDTTPKTLFAIFSDLDHGVEWGEDQLLQDVQAVLAQPQPTLPERFRAALPASIDVTRLLQYFARRELVDGAYLLRQGEPVEALSFVESGQVTAQLELGNERTVRLRTMGAGSVVGEVGMYVGTSASASVVTTQPSTIYCLSADALRQMEERDPEVAAAFHQFIARLLAERLTTTNKLVQALSD